MKPFFILAVAAVALVNCSKNNITLSTQLPANVESRFTGTVEGIDDGTRTSITYDSYAYSVKWIGAASRETAKDKIFLIDSFHQEDPALCNQMYYYATNVTADGKKCGFAEYSGDAKGDFTPPFHAIYPDYIYAEGKYTLPSVQTYVSATDAANFPMAAGSYTSELNFRNLCGIIHLAVRTSQTDIRLRNITISDAGGKAMSGDITIDWDNLEIESIEGNGVVVLDCSAANDSNGVLLSSEAQFFNIAVPAGTYTPVITINTMDGRSETMTATKSVSIVRSKFNDFKLSAGTEVVFDYAYGDSNCYFISGSNVSDESVEIDITPYCVGTDYTKGAVALKAPEAVSAVVLVTDGDITVSGTPAVDWDAKKLTVSGISGNGNAIVAIKDSDEKIIWSYHIWVPEGNPAATLNYNDKYQVMPFSLGAMDAVTDGVNGWSKGFGAYYQWGRKDPLFLSKRATEPAAQNSQSKIDVRDKLVLAGQDYTQFAVDFATAHPDLTMGLYSWSKRYIVHKQWYSLSSAEKKLWNVNAKTAYDPCPEGYIVPKGSVFSVSSSTTDKTKWKVKSYDNYGEGETNEKGYWISTGNGNYDFYPATGYLSAGSYACKPVYFSGAGMSASQLGGYFATGELSGENYVSFFFRRDYMFTTSVPHYFSINLRCVKE